MEQLHFDISSTFRDFTFRYRYKIKDFMSNPFIKLLFGSIKEQNREIQTSLDTKPVYIVTSQNIIILSDDLPKFIPKYKN